MQIYALILAAGKGIRFGGAVPKQLIEIEGSPLFIHSLRNYLGIAEISKIIVVINPEFKNDFVSKLHEFKLESRLVVTEGGESRIASIQNGLAFIENDGIVILHNSVSPLTSPSLIRACIAAAGTNNGVQAFYPAVHTIFSYNQDSKLHELIPRNNLGYTCDPTIYPVQILKRALAMESAQTNETTLDLVIKMGIPVTLIESDWTNIKVTTPLDLILLKELIRGGQEDGLRNVDIPITVSTKLVEE